MPDLPPMLRPGQTPTAAQWNALVALVTDAFRTYQTAPGAAGAGISISGTGLRGFQVQDGRTPEHWAKIGTGSGAAYAHTQAIPNGAGGFEDLPASEYRIYGTATAFPAREIRGRTDVPSGAYVRLFPDPTESAGYIFEYGPTTPANAFGLIAVSGQSDVVADAASDTVTFAGTANKIVITTVAGTDTVTWSLPDVVTITTSLTVPTLTITTALNVPTATVTTALTVPTATISTALNVPNAGLKLLDTNASHYLTIAPGSNLTADRTFTLTTGDTNRTLNISAADVTISSFAATLLDDTTAAAARATLGITSTGPSPIWELVDTVTHAELTDADTEQDVLVYTLPAKMALMGGEIRTKTAGSGGTIATLTVDLVLDGANSGGTAADGMTANALGGFAGAGFTRTHYVSSWTATKDVYARFNSSGDNLVNLTAGEWEIRLLLATLPD